MVQSHWPLYRERRLGVQVPGEFFRAGSRMCAQPCRLRDERVSPVSPKSVHSGHHVRRDGMAAMINAVEL
jgi:hypothetical protein